MKNNVQYIYWLNDSSGPRYYVVLRNERNTRHEVTESFYNTLAALLKPYEIERDFSGATYAETEVEAAAKHLAEAIVETQDAFLSMTGRI
jgi:hypothetical protein